MDYKDLIHDISSSIMDSLRTGDLILDDLFLDDLLDDDMPLESPYDISQESSDENQPQEEILTWNELIKNN